MCTFEIWYLQIVLWIYLGRLSRCYHLIITDRTLLKRLHVACGQCTWKKKRLNYYFKTTSQSWTETIFKTHESSMPFSKSIKSSPFGLATFDVRRIITLLVLLLLLLLVLLSHNLFVDFDATFDSGASGMFFISILTDALWWPSYFTEAAHERQKQWMNSIWNGFLKMKNTYVCQSGIWICT